MMRLGSLILMNLWLLAGLAFAAGERVVDVQVRGNAKVESDAILTLLKTQKGGFLETNTVQDDIVKLFDLGFFSDVRVFRKDVSGGVQIVIQVVEKPAITSIEFEGLEEIGEDTVKEKLTTKLYTIVNESAITTDVRMIEKQYAEKGFYLARVTYTLETKGANDVGLKFVVEEGGKVQVGDVRILGNQYFTEIDLVSKLASRPFTRSAAYFSSSLYQEDLLKRDLEFLSFYYRDAGFAEVKVAKPLIFLDHDREFVRITFQVEEGIQYTVSSIDLSGDLLFSKEELLEAMKLKPNNLFRISQLSKDVDMLNDRYGDLGYAYVDVNPIPTFNREQKTVAINYQIAKGPKVYFGGMTILGNSKTRDNVIRREFEVHDSELYSGTGLSGSKRNVERLGFFESVQVVKERDEQDENLMHLKFKVKEKPTGQLQAAVGFSPGQQGGESSWFGQGQFSEENFSGRAWQTALKARWNGQSNYLLEISFTDPKVYDSPWSLGLDASKENVVSSLLDGVNTQKSTISSGVTVGRAIWELIRGSLTYRIKKTEQDSDIFILDKLREDGITSSLIFGLSRRDLDNYLDPTEGSEMRVTHQLTGGPILRGDYQYQEDAVDGKYYYPVDFSETFRTYFKLHGNLSHIYPLGDQDVPLFERYRLGGIMDMRGFNTSSIGPKIPILQGPGDGVRDLNRGGDKKLLLQLEYYIPLIPEAGIKGMFFGDLGRVYNDDESIEFNDFKRDVGFGFRWITPIAPFRFEFAYPIIDGKLGEMKPIFSIGF